MIDDIPEPEEPKSDYNKWYPNSNGPQNPLIRIDVAALIALRDALIDIRLQNNNRVLDNIDRFVLQSNCEEAKDVINNIMRK
jgi:hypothetical protein